MTTLSALLIAFTFSTGIYAGIYKGFDEKGNVFYSDKPFANAEAFNLPSLSIIEAIRVPPRKQEEKKVVAFSYTDFDIVAPKNNEAIWNEANLTITLRLEPALNTASGHSIWLLKNGKPLISNSQNMTLQIGRVDRGAHNLQAQVRDKQGKVIVRTRTSIVHIKHSVTSAR